MHSYELESEKSNEFDSQGSDNDKQYSSNKNEFNSQSSNGTMFGLMTSQSDLDLYSANKDELESKLKEKNFNYTRLKNDSFNEFNVAELQKLNDLNSNDDVNKSSEFQSNSSEFTSVRKCTLEKEDWDSNASIFDDFDWEEINVKNVFTELTSNSSDFDTTDFDNNDLKQMQAASNQAKSGNSNCLAENIAESISKIFINSPDEDLRRKALNVAGANSCNELHEKIASQISTFLQVTETNTFHLDTIHEKNLILILKF